MRNKLLPILLLCTATIIGHAQSASLADSLSADLHMIRQATARHTTLWGFDLYGPLLFVDPETRVAYTNEPDSAGLFQPCGTLYAGRLPDEVLTANTATTWGGRTWAMILLPLPNDPTDRTVLLAHELFHCAQPRLHFTGHGGDNGHLDSEAGRVLLRLELEALRAALRATTPDERRTHLTRSLAFRAERHRRFPGAASSEHALERNEGLAEYTGQTVASMSADRAQAYLTARIDALLRMPTFVRSFAYATLPAYGRLAADTAPNWHRAITDETPLTDYLVRLFDLTLPDTLPASWIAAYNGDTIIRQESAREAARRSLIDSLRARLVDGPHLTLPLFSMHFSFNPSNLIPLDSTLGTVYPQLRLTDLWGTLDVTDGGALISPNWTTITVTAPHTTTSTEAHGAGWHLTLTNGYRIVRRAKDYVLEEGK